MQKVAISEACGFVIATGVLWISRLAWSGSVCAVVASRVCASHLLNRRPFKAATHAAMIVFLPDVFVALWLGELCVAASPTVNYLIKTRQRRKPNIVVLGDKLWRLVSVFSKHCRGAPAQLDAVTKKTYWVTVRGKLLCFRAPKTFTISIARWLFVQLVFISISLVRDTMIRRWVVIIWLVEKFVIV